LQPFVRLTKDKTTTNKKAVEPRRTSFMAYSLGKQGPNLRVEFDTRELAEVNSREHLCPKTKHADWPDAAHSTVASPYWDATDLHIDCTTMD